jgi:hypothetical protein
MNSVLQYAENGLWDRAPACDTKSLGKSPARKWPARGNICKDFPSMQQILIMDHLPKPCRVLDEGRDEFMQPRAENIVGVQTR